MTIKNDKERRENEWWVRENLVTGQGTIRHDNEYDDDWRYSGQHKESTDDAGAVCHDAPPW